MVIYFYPHGKNIIELIYLLDKLKGVNKFLYICKPPPPQRKYI